MGTQQVHQTEHVGEVGDRDHQGAGLVPREIDHVRAQGREQLLAEGRRLFTEKGCYGCHTVGATGTPIAPDLTRVGARHGEASLRQWLRDPAAQDATRHMPNLRLSELEAKALAAYLASLR